MDKNIKKIIFIDYENLSNIQIESLRKDDQHILMVIGQSQTKISFDTVQSAHSFGKNLDWIKIEGEGKNNLDFHIAYLLGYYANATSSDVEFIILSKDTGYDKLIEFIKKSKRKCSRYNGIDEYKFGGKFSAEKAVVGQKPNNSANSSLDPVLTERTKKVYDTLKKTLKNKRPRKRASLEKYIENLFKNQTGVNAEEITDEMNNKNLINENSGNISYNF